MTLSPAPAMASGLPAQGGALAAATPYPWPYHGGFDPRHCALVASADARWRLPGPASDRADEQLAALASGLRNAGAMVVWATAVPPRPLAGWPASGRAEDCCDRWARPEDELVPAGATSAFYASSLDDLLRSQQRRDLVVAGWGLEGPVHSTMRTANDMGYECLLVPDACTTLDPSLAGAARSMVEYSGGIFGAVALADDVLAWLSRLPSNPNGQATTTAAPQAATTLATEERK